MRKSFKIALLAILILQIAGCGRIGSIFGGGNDRNAQPQIPGADVPPQNAPQPDVRNEAVNRENRTQRRNLDEESGTDRQTIFDLFDGGDDPNITLEVNKYIWNATLDILDFLPIQSADPFSGILVFGYGAPPGGGRAYRATVYIQLFLRWWRVIHQVGHHTQDIAQWGA